MKFRLRLLIVAFSVSFLLVGALSAISYVRFSQLNDRAQRVEHSYMVARLIADLNDKIQGLDKAYFRYAITDNDTLRARFALLSGELARTIDSLKMLTSENPDQQALTIRLQADMVMYLRGAARSFSSPSIADKNAAMAQYDQSKYLNESAMENLKKMLTQEDLLLYKRNAERITYGQLTGALIKALSLVFGAVALILFFILLREFRIRALFQQQLQEKMAELAQSKNELEHIAYATSHDLQEPLRKIRILTDRWKFQQKDVLTPTTADTLDRVIAAATKMQDLVTDLMILTSLKEGEVMVPCQLGFFAQQAVETLTYDRPGPLPVINLGRLPQIYGHPEQLKLLFKNLLENALKFSRTGIEPQIDITSAVTGGEELGLELNSGQKYYCVSIRDNGVGFDNKHTDKMFGIFRQLHTHKEGFSGKGTGLAVCHRVMSNHKERITAHGFPGSGATFKLYFPANKA